MDKVSLLIPVLNIYDMASSNPWFQHCCRSRVLSRKALRNLLVLVLHSPELVQNPEEEKEEDEDEDEVDGQDNHRVP